MLFSQLKNADYFSKFVTEDFDSYIRRKKNDYCHGNNVEMQALSEMYNRPIEVFVYSTGIRFQYQLFFFLSSCYFYKKYVIRSMRLKLGKN